MWIKDSLLIWNAPSFSLFYFPLQIMLYLLGLLNLIIEIKKPDRRFSHQRWHSWFTRSPSLHFQTLILCGQRWTSERRKLATRHKWSSDNIENEKRVYSGTTRETSLFSDLLLFIFGSLKLVEGLIDSLWLVNIIRTSLPLYLQKVKRIKPSH